MKLGRCTTRGAFAVALCTALLTLGCKQQRSTDPSITGARGTTTESVVSLEPAEQLRARLYGFSDHYTAQISATSSDIAWGTSDRQLRELMIRWKLRAIPPLQKAVYKGDPRVGLLDAWIICSQMKDFFSNDPVIADLGEYSSVAIECVENLERRIEGIAREFVPEDRFQEAVSEVDRFAMAYPIREGFAAGLITASDQEAAKRHPGLFSIVAIPLSGVSEGADAVDRLARMAGVFVEVIEDLPQYARWNAEMLMLEIDSIHAVREAQANFERLSRSVESISETAKTLPEDLRRETETALEAVDSRNENLRATLEEARIVAEQVDAAIGHGREVVDAANDAADNLTQTANAWQSAVEAAQVLVEFFQPSEESPDPQDEGDSFDINEYTAAAERIKGAAVEIRMLFDDIESGKLSGTLAEIGATSQSSIDHAGTQADVLVNHILRVGLVLIGVLIAGWFMMQVLLARLIRSGPRTA
ncbi:MAG: hypothetical protein V3T53_03185 [Phycisphaerales bacterium]